jgi:hypothetical protein
MCTYYFPLCVLISFLFVYSNPILLLHATKIVFSTKERGKKGGVAKHDALLNIKREKKNRHRA